MKKHFASFEAVIADEDFFAWYNKTSGAKAQAWQQWLTSHPEYQPVIDDAINYLNEISLSEKPVSPEQTGAAHSRLMEAIGPTTEVPLVQMPTNRRWMWMAAAAVLLTLVVGYRLLMVQPETFTLAAPYGQLKNHTLPDGSVVTLNANSKLTLNKGWLANQTREVWLEGEAFFEVAKTPAKTGFVVHVNGMDVIVTGTKFNVVSRSSERSILLTEGSVTLKTTEGKELSMRAGEFVKLADKEPQKLVAPQEKLLAWKEAKLVFENTSLSEVATIIKQHYGIPVQLAEGLSTQTITGILPNNNLDALLAALEAAKGFRIVRTNEGIIISNASIL